MLLLCAASPCWLGPVVATLQGAAPVRFSGVCAPRGLADALLRVVPGLVPARPPGDQQAGQQQAQQQPHVGSGHSSGIHA